MIIIVLIDINSSSSSHKKEQLSRMTRTRNIARRSADIVVEVAAFWAPSCPASRPRTTTTHRLYPTTARRTRRRCRRYAIVSAAALAPRPRDWARSLTASSSASGHGPRRSRHRNARRWSHANTTPSTPPSRTSPTGSVQSRSRSARPGSRTTAPSHEVPTLSWRRRRLSTHLCSPFWRIVRSTARGRCTTALTPSHVTLGR